MNSLLATDGYKFSMAEVGWPLRTETFYYTHRMGGAAVVPLDIKKFIENAKPKATKEDYEYLKSVEYGMGSGFGAAMEQSITVNCLPPGAVFYDREPVFSVTGPSALVSWFEPMILQLNYRIQVASQALRDSSQKTNVGWVTCEAQKEIILETYDAVRVRPPEIKAMPEEYFGYVTEEIRKILAVVGDPDRVFEVGLRSATCMEQHLIALKACAELGIKRTSNVYGAHRLNMIPVGTMGHEHVQRYGTDEAAFRAMKDRRPARSSFLLDTFDTFKSGVPAAVKVMKETPLRRDSVRVDSGNKVLQILFIKSNMDDHKLRPVYLVEDISKVNEIQKIEEVRRAMRINDLDVLYGLGHMIVAAASMTQFTRNNVSAVYKLCQSANTPTMKFGNETGGGKESVPGRPVVWRRTNGDGPIGIIGQDGEPVLNGYKLLSGALLPEEWPQLPLIFNDDKRVIYSNETNRLRNELRAQHGIA